MREENNSLIMTENRKGIMDAFQKLVCEDYHNYCLRHQLTPTTDGVITYMIDQELIPAMKVRQFTVTKEFEEIFKEHNQHKTKTVYAISDKFNISERTIWNILKNKKSKAQ